MVLAQMPKISTEPEIACYYLAETNIYHTLKSRSPWTWLYIPEIPAPSYNLDKSLKIFFKLY